MQILSPPPIQVFGTGHHDHSQEELNEATSPDSFYNQFHHILKHETRTIPARQSQRQLTTDVRTLSSVSLNTLGSNSASSQPSSGSSTPFFSAQQDLPVMQGIQGMLQASSEAPIHAAESGIPLPQLPELTPTSSFHDLEGLTSFIDQDVPVTIVDEPETIDQPEGKRSSMLPITGFPFLLPPNRIDRSASLSYPKTPIEEITDPSSGQSSPSVSIPPSDNERSATSSRTPSLRRRERSKSVPNMLNEHRSTLFQQLEDDGHDAQLTLAIQSRTTHLNRKTQKLLGAVSEVLDSEIAYLNDLCILKEVYFDAIDTSLAASPEAKAVIKRNLAEIFSFHKRLAGFLLSVDATTKWRQTRRISNLLDAAAGISRIFLENITFLSLYEEFCSQHADAMALLHMCQEDRASWELYTTLCASRMASHAGRCKTPTTRAQLHLYDYAIKPVQRICRYPMLFDSIARVLNVQDEAEKDAATQVRLALNAISKCAANVDRARQRMVIGRRTNIVASRIEMPSASQATLLGILGQVQLVGALYFSDLAMVDQGIRVKYYGCFLYATHLVLVKVRRQDGYEPRHWLPLRIFDIDSLADEDASLPNSFRLTYGKQQFELSCITSSERDLWHERISEGIDLRRQYWRKSMLQANVETCQDTIVSSIPVDPASENYFAVPEPLARIQQMMTKPARQRMSQRASNLIGRSISASRAAVDIRLADIFSDECLMARGHGDSNFASMMKPNFVNLRSQSTDAAVGMPSNQSVSRRATFKDTVRRRSGILEQGRGFTRSSNHYRRNSADVISVTTTDLGKTISARSMPSSPSATTRDLPQLQTSDGEGKFKGGLLRRRSSLVAAQSAATSGASAENSSAEVSRNLSASSSGSSNSIHVLQTPCASPTSFSPQIASQDYSWPATGGIRDIFGSLRRKTSASSFSVPTLGSLDQDEQAAKASSFLYGRPVTTPKGTLLSWRDGWKSKRNSQSSIASASSRRTNSSESLRTMFTPVLSPTIGSPTSDESHSSARTPSEDSEIGIETIATGNDVFEATSMPIPSAVFPQSSASTKARQGKPARQRSLRLFRNLNMTSISRN